MALNLIDDIGVYSKKVTKFNLEDDMGILGQPPEPPPSPPISTTGVTGSWGEPSLIEKIGSVAEKALDIATTPPFDVGQEPFKTPQELGVKIAKGFGNVLAMPVTVPAQLYKTIVHEPLKAETPIEGLKESGKAVIENLKGFGEFMLNPIGYQAYKKWAESGFEGEPKGLGNWQTIKKQWAIDPVFSVLGLAGLVGILKTSVRTKTQPAEIAEQIKSQLDAGIEPKIVLKQLKEGQLKTTEPIEDILGIMTEKELKKYQPTPAEETIKAEQTKMREAFAQGKTREQQLEETKINAIDTGKATELLLDKESIGVHIKEGIEAGLKPEVIENNIRELLIIQSAKEIDPLKKIDYLRAEKQLNKDVTNVYEKYLKVSALAKPIAKAGDNVLMQEARGKTLDEFVEGQRKDKIFHGTGKPMINLQEEVYSALNFYGQGLYTTDTFAISEGYTKKGGKIPTIYEIKAKDVKLFDMETKLTPDIIKKLNDSMLENYVEIGEGQNLREVYDMVRDDFGNDIPAYEIQEIYDSMRGVLKIEGYRGLKYIGGLRTGKAPHEVKIYWNPNEDVISRKESITKSQLTDIWHKANAPEVKPIAKVAPEGKAKEPWEMTRSEFRGEQLTGNIRSDAYKQYETAEGLSWLKKKQNPKLYAKKDFGGKQIEFRKSGEKLRYTRVENNEIVRDKEGLATYLTDAEAKAKGYLLESNDIVAFDGNKAIGLVSNEFGATGVWVIKDYQKQGIGKYLLNEYRKGMPFSRKLGQSTEVGYNLVGSWHKDLIQQALSEGKSVPAKVLKEYPDLTKPEVAPKGGILGSEGGFIDLSKQPEEPPKISNIPSGLIEKPIRGKQLKYKNQPIEIQKNVTEVGKDSIKALNDALKIAEPKRKILEKAYTSERTKRITEVEKAINEIGGEKGYGIALSKLKGEMASEAKIQFAPIKDKLTKEQLDGLYNETWQHPYFNAWEKISTTSGLTDLLIGKIPQPKQLVLLEEVYGTNLIKNILAKRALGLKIKDVIVETMNIPRAILATADMSAFLRQGIIEVAAHPIISGKAIGKTFQFAFNPKIFADYFKELPKDKLYPLMRESKLAITDPFKAGMVGREEAFMSRLLQKIPIFGQIIKFSERSYVGFLNKLRVDLFKMYANEFLTKGFSPHKDAKLFKASADIINTFTGRGSLGKLNRITPELNTLFFSPRLIAARFNALNPVWYAKMPKEIRIKAIGDFAKFVGVGLTTLALAKVALGDKASIEINPKSSDFGKVRIGNTRWDIWGGFQQWIRVFAQLITGERKDTTTGKIISLSKDEYPFTTRKEVILRFIEGKLAPVPALLNELISGGKTFTGEDMTLTSTAKKELIPMYIDDIADAYQDGGLGRSIGAGIPAFFGVGVQTWRKKGQPGFKETEERKKQIEEIKRKYAY